MQGTETSHLDALGDVGVGGLEVADAVAVERVEAVLQGVEVGRGEAPQVSDGGCGSGGDEGERRKLRSAAAAGDDVRHAEGEETPEESREAGLGVATLGLALDLGLAFGFGLEEAALVVALGLAMADSGSTVILSLRGRKREEEI